MRSFLDWATISMIHAKPRMRGINTKDPAIARVTLKHSSVDSLTVVSNLKFSATPFAFSAPLR
jgi:hypothetical protein